jgi:hypothetical protein
LGYVKLLQYYYYYCYLQNAELRRAELSRTGAITHSNYLACEVNKAPWSRQVSEVNV